MRKVAVRNKLLLEDLKKTEVLITENRIDDFELSGKSFTRENRDHWTGPTHLKYIIKQGHDHEGYPDYHKSYSVQHNTLKLANDRDEERLASTMKMLGDVRMSLSENFLFRQNALFTIYPPGGFISWHNNANASAFNLIFTWSETGEGDFTYLDRNRNKLVTIKDEPGWQAKGGFFASYRENPRHLVYHSAKTDCWRITIAFVLDRSEFSRQMQKEIIQDIETEIV